MEEASSDGKQGDGGIAQHFSTLVHQNQTNCKVFNIFTLYIQNIVNCDWKPQNGAITLSPSQSTGCVFGSVYSPYIWLFVFHF